MPNLDFDERRKERDPVTFTVDGVTVPVRPMRAKDVIGLADKDENSMETMARIGRAIIPEEHFDLWMALTGDEMKAVLEAIHPGLIAAGTNGETPPLEKAPPRPRARGHVPVDERAGEEEPLGPNEADPTPSPNETSAQA